MEDLSNPDFKLAADFINYTNCSLFLTGKAGTGKTTFLKYCKANTIKNTAIVAPTGVAAMNAGGTTIHSFFQLPIIPFSPAPKRPDEMRRHDKHSLIGRLRFSSEQKELLQRLELLIIDEVSMVRCDTVDAIDAVLRHVRQQSNKPFGGVQVLCIGDLQQLPPVNKKEEWELIASYYPNPHFFSSNVIQQYPLVYVELSKIYRQKDAVFIDILNQVRNKELTQTGFDRLHERYQPGFKPAAADNYITLTARNDSAEAINFSAVNQLPGSFQVFDAVIEGEFNDNAVPADVQLRLKPGAQVMFIRNDAEKEKRYYNGKIGIVKKMESDKIIVECKESDVEVKKEKWRNIRYITDAATNKITEDEIGSFLQYPLRLAWAITIHKSQGLTFEKAVIDAGNAFVAGQVYVALSRCTSLEGMILHSRITNEALRSDKAVTDFALSRKPLDMQLQLLDVARNKFQQEQILQLFDFSGLVITIKAIAQFLETHSKSFNESTSVFISGVNLSVDTLNNTSLQFFPRLEQLFETNGNPENNEALQLRIAAAANHFIGGLEKLIAALQSSPAATDSRTYAIGFNKLLTTFYDAICWSLHLLDGCRNRFVLVEFMEHKRKFAKQSFAVNAYSGKRTAVETKSTHPVLYKLLHDKRDAICKEKKLPVYLVANGNTLEEMSNYLPQTMEQLGMISGFGPVKTKQFGPAFLPIIQQYCEQNNLSTTSAITPIKTKRTQAKKTNEESTYTRTWKLYKAGKSIAAIAKERSLATGTIESHIAHFIELGKIDILEFVPAETLVSIRAAVETYGKESTLAVGENLPNTITYGDIRFVRAHMKRSTAG